MRKRFLSNLGVESYNPEDTLTVDGVTVSQEDPVDASIEDGEALDGIVADASNDATDQIALENYSNLLKHTRKAGRLDRGAAAIMRINLDVIKGNKPSVSVEALEDGVDMRPSERKETAAELEKETEAEIEAIKGQREIDTAEVGKGSGEFFKDYCGMFDEVLKQIERVKAKVAGREPSDAMMEIVLPDSEGVLIGSEFHGHDTDTLIKVLNAAASQYAIYRIVVDNLAKAVSGTMDNGDIFMDIVNQGLVQVKQNLSSLEGQLPGGVSIQKLQGDQKDIQAAIGMLCPQFLEPGSPAVDNFAYRTQACPEALTKRLDIMERIVHSFKKLAERVTKGLIALDQYQKASAGSSDTAVIELSSAVLKLYTPYAYELNDYLYNTLSAFVMVADYEADKIVSGETVEVSAEDAGLDLSDDIVPPTTLANMLTDGDEERAEHVLNLISSVEDFKGLTFDL